MPRKSAAKQAAAAEPINENAKLLTADEAAALLKIGRAKMAELINSGAIKTIEISPRIRRIRMSALQQYVDSL